MEERATCRKHSKNCANWSARLSASGGGSTALSMLSRRCTPSVQRALLETSATCTRRRERWIGAACRSRCVSPKSKRHLTSRQSRRGNSD